MKLYNTWFLSCSERIAQYHSDKDHLIPSAALVKEAAQHACAAAWVNDTQQRARLPVCLEGVGPATDGQEAAHIRSLQNRVEGR